MLRLMTRIAALVLALVALTTPQTQQPEATSLLGKPLFAPEQAAETRSGNEKNLAAARAEFDKNPSSADAAIWLGRRTAYLGRFRDAIAIYTEAIARHSTDARIYRHRGHRYISVRNFDAAIADLSKAASLVAARPDEVEPDGQPNARNTPTGTLKTNIYYHLGLAHYLKGEFEKAADAYRLCMDHSKNADMQVATAHWQYMTLRRLNRTDDALKVLAPITPGMDVFENGSYHRLLLMYKAADPSGLLQTIKQGGLDGATIGYGVANWYLYNGRADQARAILQEIVEGIPSQWASFGYIAAEADFARTRQEPPAGAIWIDSLDMSQVQMRRPRAGRGQPSPPPPLKLSLGGVEYAHGIPLNVNADLVIDLKASATSFQSTVGVDDTRATGAATVTFDVWVDGKLAATSGTMRSGDAPKLLAVDLTGAKQLILAVGDAGDGTRDDQVIWAGARLQLAPGTQLRPQVVTLPSAAAAIASARTPEPRLNSPKIVGGTPGRPFLFLIPATGEAPLTFTAKNLPAGLKLDASSGIISGAIAAEGRTIVDLTVTSKRGRAAGKLTIVGGRDALALTPPLGWNSWNVWGGEVDDAKVRAAADGLVTSGLAGQGYAYVNIDDAWEGPRNAAGEITANEKFPDMKALADYVHAKGLKIGIYSSPGPRTCQQRYAGSWQHEKQDAETWAKWGFDYIKYDWCSYTDIEPAGARTELAGLKKPYALMRGILDTLDRDMVFSLCQYGWGNVWEWGDEVGGNLWRTTGDITDTWASMSSIGFAQTGHEQFAGPGRWNDTDMLVVGKVGWGRELRDSRLSQDEQVTHITLWSLQAAPLLIGADLSQVNDFTIDLLGNREVMAVNQDVLGKAARRIRGDGRVDVWARPLEDGTIAVGLFNRNPVAAAITATWKELGLSGSQPVRDLWLQKDLAARASEVSATVPRHGAVFLKIGKGRQP
jgi:alpha-galactosidase